MPKFKPQYKRMLFIDMKVREGGYPNCSTLSDEWEVSSKTIQRDIDYMKYELNAPIEYDPKRHGYYYTEESYRMPAITISESDLFSVCIAERALKQFEHTPLYSKLVNVFNRIEDSLPSSTTVNPAWIDDRIFFFSEPSTMIDTTIWETVANAIRENRRLSISHSSPSGSEETTRTLDPYHLVNFKGEWYLSCYCHLREAIRTFALSRISSANIMNETFTMPASFGREQMFGDPFGIIWNAETHLVKIRFSKKTAPYIEERTWHPGQKVSSRTDGSVILEFETNHLNEVKDWVLSWGPGAEVLKPKLLIERVKKDLYDTLSLYS